MTSRVHMWLLSMMLGLAALAQTPPQDAKQRAFRVEAKPEENLEQVPGLKERYALIIGISKYADPALSLNYAAADAQSLYKVLSDPEVGAYKPENIRLLVDDQETRKNIVSAMNTWLKNRVTADDSVLIFYSGHGALGNTSEAYWVSYDADAEDLAASAISNKEISSAIASLPATLPRTGTSTMPSNAVRNWSRRSRRIARPRLKMTFMPQPAKSTVSTVGARTQPNIPRGLMRKRPRSASIN